MKRKRFVIGASVAVAAGVIAALLVAPMITSHVRKPPGMQAHWADHYVSLRDMVRDVDAIVFASVLGSRPGRVVSTSAGTAVLPFTLVDLRVERAIRGQVTGLITLEQTGGHDGTRAIYIDGDGGPYDRGEQVLLFLKRQPDTGYYYLVNPQGRFAVEKGRLLAASPDDHVAQRLDTRGVGEAIGLIRSNQ
jgi:hypothetical protein